MKKTIRFIILTAKILLILLGKLLVMGWDLLVYLVSIVDGGREEDQAPDIVPFSYDEDHRSDMSTCIDAQDGTYQPGQSKPFYRLY